VLPASSVNPRLRRVAFAGDGDASQRFVDGGKVRFGGRYVCSFDILLDAVQLRGAGIGTKPN
jgi:hypothetical protein